MQRRDIHHGIAISAALLRAASGGGGDARAARVGVHIPHTVIVRPRAASSRQKIFSSHGRPSRRSKTAGWPGSPSSTGCGSRARPARRTAPRSAGSPRDTDVASAQLPEHGDQRAPDQGVDLVDEQHHRLRLGPHQRVSAAARPFPKDGMRPAPPMEVVRNLALAVSRAVPVVPRGLEMRVRRRRVVGGGWGRVADELSRGAAGATEVALVVDDDIQQIAMGALGGVGPLPGGGPGKGDEH